MSHNNISIFVPHIGCPHMCAFCNQRTITGTEKIPHADDVRKICTQAMNEIDAKSETEIAFFGGSFTAVPREYMLELLEAADEFVGEGKFKGIRISTRPDYINKEILDILASHNVTSIELGAQSMSDKVLVANERGHSSEDVKNASALIKSYGRFELGLQMMVGLYKSTIEDEKKTWSSIVALSPKTVRIYPVVILKGTKLGELYESKEFQPMDFNEVVDICADLLSDAKQHNIDVIKLGLHASEIVESQMLGGFYHPAFREICEGRNYLKKLKSLLDDERIKKAVISVAPKELSKAIGQKRCNIKYFEERGTELKIIPDSTSIDLKIEEIKYKGGETRCT